MSTQTLCIKLYIRFINVGNDKSDQQFLPADHYRGLLQIKNLNFREVGSIVKG